MLKGLGVCRNTRLSAGEVISGTYVLDALIER
jgi:hypothetical protein